MGTLQNIFQIFTSSSDLNSSAILQSSAAICTSSSDLNFLQIFSLTIISTSFVTSISLSSGDILPSSSYLNFHFGRLPFWLSSILVVFHFGRLPILGQVVLHCIFV